MAVIETWIKTDLQSIVKIKMMHGILFSQDNMANLIGVELLDGGEPATVSGSVSANVLRADGTTVAVAGTLSGNLASVTLPQAAYAVPGTVAIAIKLTTGSTVTTIGAIQSVVYRTSSDTIIDPGTIIPSVQDLIAAIEDAVESIPPDYSELTGEVSDLKNTTNAYLFGDVLTQRSDNLFNDLLFDGKSGLTKIGHEITGAANKFSAAEITGIFAENTRYTIGYDLYTDGNETTTGYGLRCRIYYTDGTQTNVETENSTSSFAHKTKTTDANKTVNKIVFVYGSGGSNVWHLKNIMIAAGTTDVTFIPYYITYGEKIEMDTLPGIVTGLGELSARITVLENTDARGDAFYPYANDTEYKNYAEGILWLYVKNKQSNATYYLKSVRYNEIATQSQWTGKRTEISLSYIDSSDVRHDLPAIVMTDYVPTSNIEKLENSDFAVLVDWSKMLDGQGYAAVSSSVTLNDNMGDPCNNIWGFVVNNGGQNIEQQLQNHLQAYNPHNITKDTIGLENATVNESGLMSASDKQKLVNIVNPGTITIEGSGVTKNASAFGFLPTNDGVTNATALQSALSGGGTVLVDYPGVYDLARTILIPSNTSIVFGANTFIRRTTVNNVYAKYVFVNEGAFSKTINENITIQGLSLITNGLGGGTDIAGVYGLNAQLAFSFIKNLKLLNFETLNGTIEYYNVQISNFENVLIDGCHIESVKDGLHFGAGKKFTIKNAIFKTNDDAIALNAHDYPTGTTCLGWIEDGVIENIHFLAAPNFNNARGIYMLGGSWANWSSGMSVRTYGDAVVSGGRIYRTTGEIVQEAPYAFITSTVQPTFESGTQTLSDGVTWTMVQDYNVVNNAGVKNVSINNIFVDRQSTCVLRGNFDNDRFSRSYYPGSDAPVFDNIVMSNVFVKPGIATYIVEFLPPIRKLRLYNVDMNDTANAVKISDTNGDSNLDYGTAFVTIVGCAFVINNSNKYVLNGTTRTCLFKISDSIVTEQTATPIAYGSNTTVAYNDIGIQ